MVFHIPRSKSSKMWWSELEAIVVHLVCIIFSRELSILYDLVQAQVAISEWDFLPALLSIFSTSEKLHSWKGIHVLENQVGCCFSVCVFAYNFIFDQPEYSKGKIRSKMSLLDTIPLPELYQWMCRMMVVLLSKVGIFYCEHKFDFKFQFSFYFESVLSQQATATDMKAIGSRLQIDFVSLYVHKK